MPASAALSHIKVIDLTRVRAGPTAVRQLADWGARVIKVEMPAGLDEGEGPGGPRQVSHPPKQGEHTAEVLRELGYEDEKIDELRKKGIV